MLVFSHGMMLLRELIINQDQQAGIQFWYDASMRTIHELGSTCGIQSGYNASMRTIHEIGSKDWHLVMV